MSLKSSSDLSPNSSRLLELFRKVNLPGHFLVGPSESLDQDKTEEASLNNLGIHNPLVFPRDNQLTHVLLKRECTESHSKDRSYAPENQRDNNADISFGIN